MRLNFGKLFQEFSKDISMSGLVRIPTDSSFWPVNWKNIEYKIYNRFKSIKLPEPISREYSQKYLLNRRSFIDFSRDKYSSNKITLQELSNILYYSAGENKTISSVNRIYPSAGGRYSIEIYILNFIEGDLEKAVYHYNVRDHSLELLWNIKQEDIDNKRFCSYDWSVNAGMCIVLTADIDRFYRKYKERGYKLMYLESGIILNNIHINSMISGFSSVIMGATNEIQIEELLDIDGVNETVILSILIGN